MTLTGAEQQLFEEVEKIAELTQVNYTSVEKCPPDKRTARLHIAIHRMVVSEIVVKYTIIDEMLSDIIGRYFFESKGTLTGGREAKQFILFSEHILDGLYLSAKLDLVEAIKPLPKDICSISNHPPAESGALSLVPLEAASGSLRGPDR
jgi:hypothetical protein